jgi:hypothetical protein
LTSPADSARKEHEGDDKGWLPHEPIPCCCLCHEIPDRWWYELCKEMLNPLCLKCRGSFFNA